jgi:hypothetical protein
MVWTAEGVGSWWFGSSGELSQRRQSEGHAGWNEEKVMDGRGGGWRTLRFGESDGRRRCWTERCCFALAVTKGYNR